MFKQYNFYCLPVYVISEVEVVFSVSIGHQSARSHVSRTEHLR